MGLNGSGSGLVLAFSGPGLWVAHLGSSGQGGVGDGPLPRSAEPQKNSAS